MDKHITCCIHPFVTEQEVNVYENGECIRTSKCTLDNLEETIYSFVNLYNIKQIDLAGNQLYSLKVKEKMMNSKYNLEGINITVY